MRFSIVVAAILPLAIASPFELDARAKDNSAKVLSGLKKEDSQGQAINKSFNAIGNNDKPTTKQITAIDKQTSALNKAIKATTKQATSSSTFSDSGSASIGNYVNGTLAPDTISILNNIIAHCPGFNSAGYAGVVAQSLKEQMGLVSKQATSITAKLTEPYKSQSPSVTQPILDKYSEAISTYNSKNCS